MNYAERNIDHRVGKAIIWTERVVPTEDGDIYYTALYRTKNGNYSGIYPAYESTNLRKRSRNELARILNTLRNYHE